MRILQLHVRYEADVLAGALERALRLGCWSADGVEQLVRQACAPDPHPDLDLDLDMDTPPAWAAGAAGAVEALSGLPELAIPLPDLHRFDALLEVGS